MKPQPLDRTYLKQKDYAAIVETNDEFEDLIGIVDEIYDSKGDICKDTRTGTRVALRIPLTREEQKLTRLYGVNDITRYARQQVQLNDGCLLINTSNLEIVNPEDL